jgi:hypothetical protein
MKQGQRTDLRAAQGNSANVCSDLVAASEGPCRSSGARVLWQVDLAKRYRVDRITIYRWERASRLPPPDIIIGRRRGRYESTIVVFERASVDHCESDATVFRSVSNESDSLTTKLTTNAEF